MKKKGKIIVIEGTDGSGKKTQVNLLFERLRKEGHQVSTLSFPQYGKKSAGLVEEYLNGKYGDPTKVNPYAASLFYAVDRFDVSAEIRRLLEEGNVLILDRYVDSNAGHQGGKIKDSKERKKFLKWLYNLEYKILNVPKPDIVLVLHVPAEIGQKLVEKKEQRSYIKKGTHDGHEADLGHLKNSEAAYQWLTKEHSRDHKMIECMKDDRLLAPEEISEMVYKIVKDLIIGN